VSQAGVRDRSALQTPLLTLSNFRTSSTTVFPLPPLTLRRCGTYSYYPTAIAIWIDVAAARKRERRWTALCVSDGLRSCGVGGDGFFLAVNRWPIASPVSYPTMSPQPAVVGRQSVNHVKRQPRRVDSCGLSFRRQKSSKEWQVIRLLSMYMLISPHSCNRYGGRSDTPH